VGPRAGLDGIRYPDRPALGEFLYRLRNAGALEVRGRFHNVCSGLSPWKET